MPRYSLPQDIYDKGLGMLVSVHPEPFEVIGLSVPSWSVEALLLCVDLLKQFVDSSLQLCVHAFNYCLR